MDTTVRLEGDFLYAVELHSADGICAALRAGLDPTRPIRDKPPIDWLTEMYTRSDAFKDCVRVLLDAGAVLTDPVVAPVLLDDAEAVAKHLRDDPTLVEHRTSMVSAFTPLVGASLLHVAAEFGQVNAARALVEMGAAVDARAAVDAYGLNGHTPLFHTVSSSGNRSAPILRLLLAAGARSDVLLAGITWGAGFEWETTCFDVTPISYAQLGLLPQMHRRSADVYDNVDLLLAAAGREVPPRRNVPNRYLVRDPGL